MGGGVAGGCEGAGSGALGPRDTGGIGGAAGSVCTVTVGAGTGIGGGASVRSGRAVAQPAARRRMTAPKPLSLLLGAITCAWRHPT
jgi:hypothetical protein